MANGFLDKGLDHDAVLAAFVQDYGGQHVLAAPIDKGFNRLAWFFPYFLGLAGAVGIAVVAIKWSRRGDEGHEAPAAQAEDSALKQRLDDELRDLD